MAFTGKEDHAIALPEASELTKRYRESINPGQILGGFFGRDAIEKILAQEGCVGIRYYYGLDSGNKQVLVLSGVKSNEDDLYDGVLMELSKPCPNYCGSANALNSNQ